MSSAGASVGSSPQLFPIVSVQVQEKQLEDNLKLHVPSSLNLCMHVPFSLLQDLPSPSVKNSYT